VSRIPVYASTNAKRIRVTFKYLTSAGSTYSKYICFELFRNVGTPAVEDAGPLRLTSTTGNPLRVTTEQTTSEQTIVYDLNIPDGRFNMFDEANPLELIVFCYTENAAEYIIPQSLHAEEIPLSQSEFP
jgi:hypothetical protein